MRSSRKRTGDFVQTLLRTRRTCLAARALAIAVGLGLALHYPTQLAAKLGANGCPCTQWTEQRKLLAPDGAASDTFGRGVAINGEFAVVGGQHDDVGANEDQGSAYLFARNQGGAGQWGFVKKLTAPDGGAFNFFGLSVAVNGNTVAVGAPWAMVGGNTTQGAVYLFGRNQGGADNWGLVKKVVAMDGQRTDQFGHAVALNGDTLVAGLGPLNAGDAAYVFERNQGGADNWGQVKKLTQADGAGDDNFGTYVAISGNTVVVGADNHDVGANTDQGAVYVYERDLGGAHNWGLAKKLTAPDGAAIDLFGRTVGLSGDVVVAGAPLDQVGDNSEQGSAYLFARNQGGAGQWGFVKKLLAANAAAGDQFGFGVGISGDTVVVGAHFAARPGFQDGTAYVFARHQGGADNWGQVQELTVSDSPSDAEIGFPVAVSDNTAIIGARFADFGSASAQGAAYIFAGPCTPAPANLSSWWKGDGSALDAIGGKHGTLQGSVSFAPGVVGQAFQFDGNNGYVALPAGVFPFPTSAPFTFELWFKTMSGGVMLGQQEEFVPYFVNGFHVPALYVGTDGRLRSELFWKGVVAPITSAAPVNDGLYHHVAVTFSNNTETVYLDGNLMGSAANTPTPYAGAAPNAYTYQFGTGYTAGWPGGNGGWFNFNGLLDELSLYSRALTQAEAQAIYAAGPGGKCCPLVTLATLSGGTVGAAYNRTISAAPLGSYSFTASGTLPPGLSLSPAGVLSGTPTQPGTFNFSVTATLPGGCAGTRDYDLTIICPTITLSALPGGVVGAGYSQTITAMPAGSHTFSASGTLPPGLSLSSAGVLSGTPTQAGTFNFSVTATLPSGCMGTSNYSLTILCPTITLLPTSLPNATANTAYSQTLSAMPAGLNYSFAVTSGALPAGLSLSSAGALSGAPTQTGTFAFRVTASGTGPCSGFHDYLLTVLCPALTVNPASLPGGTDGAAYNQTVSASPSGAYALSVTSGALPPGLLLNAATGALTGTPTSTGAFNFTITASVGNCAGARAYTVVITCPALSFTSASPLPAGQVGVAYSQTLAVTPASAYSFSLVAGSLPNGLTLNASTGIISGTPITTGASSFTIKAQMASGCSTTKAYALTIICPMVTLNPAALPSGTTGTAYSQTIAAAPAGGNYSYAVSGSLPPGLNLNPATGVLSGTPTANGSFSFTVTATGFGGCSGNRSYSLTIGGGGCPTISLPALPAGSVGQLYSNYIAPTPAGVYSYVVTTGALPPGLTLYANGLLYGYPTQAGSYSFTLKATDANNCSGMRSYTVVIN